MLMTVDQLRQYFSSDLSDDQLLQKIQTLENFVRNYTHNNFQKTEIRSYSPAYDNLLLNPPPHITKGDTIQISDSLLNNGLYLVTNISGMGMTVDKPLIDCEKNLVTKIFYPPDVILGAVNILKWDFDNRDKIGIHSETISRHSITYFNMDGENAVMGYPKSLLGFLKPYMKARF